MSIGNAVTYFRSLLKSYTVSLAHKFRHFAIQYQKVITLSKNDQVAISLNFCSLMLKVRSNNLGRINNTSLSSELGPNKLECYIKLGQKVLLVANTLTYWACS
jgi:hypothetical protein